MTPYTIDNFYSCSVSYNRAGTRVVDRVKKLFSPVDDVGRYCHCPDAPDGKIADKVFGRAVEINTDPVSFPHSERYEAETNPVHLFAEFPVAVSLVPRGANKGGFCGRNAFCIEECADVGHGAGR